MSKIFASASQVIRHPLPWACVATAGFYAAIYGQVLTEPLVVRYAAGHWAAHLCVGLFFLGLSGLVLRAWSLRGQSDALRQQLLDPAPAEGQPITACAVQIARLDKQPARVRRSYLAVRLRAALDYVQRVGNGDTLEAHLRSLSDADFARQQASQTLVRAMIWAIPFLGSLGTVIGIGAAVGQLTAEQLANPMSSAAPGLELAFDTTALSLGLSVVLMLLMYLVDHWESGLLDAVDARAMEDMVGRFKSAKVAQRTDARGASSSAAGPELAALLAEAVEKIAERQAQMFRELMDAENARWDQRAATLPSGGSGGSGGIAAAARGGFAAEGNGGAGGNPSLMPHLELAILEQAGLLGSEELNQHLAKVIGQGSLHWPARKAIRPKQADAATNNLLTLWLDKAG